MPWTYKGSTISQPGVIAPIDNSGIANVTNANDRVLVIVGSSGGGEPKKVLEFTNSDSAIATLVSGSGLTAVLRALRPASDETIAPGRVRYVRVDPATKSAYDLKNGATTALSLTTVGYGEYTKQANTLVKAGSVRGLSATITLNDASKSQDNIYAAPLQIQYVGSDDSGLVTIANSSGQIQGLSGDLGSETVAWTAQFSAYPAIQSLINFINAQVGWSATLLTGNANGKTANYFDDATAQACKASAYVVTATLDALKSFYNGSGIVLASRPAGIGTLPSAMSAPAYFTGGTSGSTTNEDWADALAALQSDEEIRIITAVTGDASIHAMVDAHCHAMSDPAVHRNRVQIAGGVLGESVTQAISRASALNSRRTTLVYPGIQDVDALTQTLTTYDPFIAAAQAGAILSSLSVTSALTNQKLACKGLEGTLQYALKKNDYDTLTDNGVMSIKFKANQTAGNGYVFVRSLTTWMQDTKIVNQELSAVCNEDYVTVRVADAIDASLVGATGSPVGVGNVLSTIDGTLRDLYREGAIVGDTLKDAYGNINITVAGDGSVTGGYSATIPVPMNFFGITSGFRIYANSAQGA